jgi:acetyl-CoA carboxylase carboxyltransferase component
MHTSVSGVADHLARDDAHALAIARGIVGDLGADSAVDIGVGSMIAFHSTYATEHQLMNV